MTLVNKMCSYITKDENGLIGKSRNIHKSSKNILDSNGDYDMGGKVTNFNYTFREDGALIAQLQYKGWVLLDKEIDLDGNSVGTRKANSESKPKFAPPDSMINCILNLRDIIFFEVLYSYKLTKKWYKGKVDSQGSLSNKNNRIYFDNKRNKNKGQINYGIAADNQENPNILYM